MRVVDWSSWELGYNDCEGDLERRRGWASKEGDGELCGWSEVLLGGLRGVWKVEKVVGVRIL